MKTNEDAIGFAAAWMSDAAKKVCWGEISATLVLHDGQVVRVERLTVDKTQRTAVVSRLTITDTEPAL